MRGTTRRPRRLRFVFTLIGFMCLLMSGVCFHPAAVSQDDVMRDVGLMFIAIGLACLGLVLLTKPIAHVTFRARMAGLWYSRHARRRAVNTYGASTRRARRRITNRAAWAAQRQRDGRAAQVVMAGRASPYPAVRSQWKEERRQRLAEEVNDVG